MGLRIAESHIEGLKKFIWILNPIKLAGDH